jgi:hypothetical protein
MAEGAAGNRLEQAGRVPGLAYSGRPEEKSHPVEQVLVRMSDSRAADVRAPVDEIARLSG